MAAKEISKLENAFLDQRWVNRMKANALLCDSLESSKISHLDLVILVDVYRAIFGP
jgi:hypothetical protein